MMSGMCFPFRCREDASTAPHVSAPPDSCRDDAATPAAPSSIRKASGAAQAMKRRNPNPAARVYEPAGKAQETEHERSMAFGGCRSEEHTSELQSHSDLVCRLLLEKKKHMNSSRLALTTTTV